MMWHRDTFDMAWQNLLLNRKRSALAMVGIVIGVVGVLVMGMVGSSGKKMIFEEIKTFGLQTVWIYRDSSGTIPGQESLGGTGIESTDIRLILDGSRWINRISGVIERSQWVSRDNKLVLGQVLYVEPDYFEIESDQLISGRLLSQSDMDFSRRVCVVGQDTATTLFGSQNILGKTLCLADSSYEIVGVLAKKDRDFLKSIGVGDGQSPNGRILIPLSVILSESDSQQIDYIQLSAVSTQDSDKAAQDAVQVLNRVHHGQFQYTQMAMKSYIDSLGKISKIVAVVLAVAVLISLIVGGIGIANVMTIAVVERTREIGIRKSIGATPNDIFQLFLMESVVLTSCAGFIGVGIGSFFGVVGCFVLPKTFVFPFEFVGLGVGVAVITGVIFGVYPAMHAAKKSPVEALRHE